MSLTERFSNRKSKIGFSRLIHVSHSEWRDEKRPRCSSGFLVPRESSRVQPHATRTLELVGAVLAAYVEARATLIASHHLRQIPREYNVLGTT